MDSESYSNMTVSVFRSVGNAMPGYGLVWCEMDIKIMT
jgi:hypothetical protein